MYMMIEYLALRSILTLWDIIVIWIPDDVNQLHEIFQEVCPLLENVTYRIYNTVTTLHCHVFRRSKKHPIFARDSDDIITSFINQKRAHWKLQKYRLIPSLAATSLSTADLISYAAGKIDRGQIDVVFDTGTKESVCNNKSLFVSEIAPLTGVSLNGVGGSIRAEGHGTIQLVVRDDDNRKHRLSSFITFYMCRLARSPSLARSA